MIKGKLVGYPEHFDLKPPGPDGRVWTVENPEGKFGFVFDDGTRVIPHDGFRIDGASIPRPAWRIIGPPTGYGSKANYLPAAACHDKAYVSKCCGDGRKGRKRADQMMLVAMIQLGVSKWRRNLMYAVLRLFGGKHYGRAENRFPGA